MTTPPDTDPVTLTQRAVDERWWAYVSTDDGDVIVSGRLDRDGDTVILEGEPLTIVDATATAGGTVFARTEDGYDVVLRATPRTQ